jgi:adenylate cyclase
VKRSEKFVQFSASFLFVFLYALLLFVNPKPLQRVLRFLENGIYDFQLRQNYRPPGNDPAVVIIDIDDESIEHSGQWPWPRETLARLVSNLFELGAKVIAFDMTFPSLRQAGAEGKSGEDLLAASMQQGLSVLGFAFKPNESQIGRLPPPLLTLNSEEAKKLYIPEMNGYIANLELFQKAAVYGGFMNTNPDRDGVMRFSPLLFRHGNALYGSLALEAARLYLEAKAVGLVYEDYVGERVLEGIALGSRVIPVDPWGKILIPFRGPPFSIPYISAKRVGVDPALDQEIKGKLVFIGSSATAIGDLRATAISPIFAGVEIHAAIALGIIDEYLPHRPVWGKGLSILSIAGLGCLLGFVLPRLGIISGFLTTVSLIGAVFATGRWAWLQKDLVIDIFPAIFTISSLYIINSVLGFLLERRRRQELKEIFGQYVPAEYIQSMMDKNLAWSLKGETKELTVLFADIRSFSAFSENMTADELKEFLNLYLSDMTEVIFEEKGTIDKYVGDLIMAFWGAPVPNPDHAVKAVAAGLKMQERLNRFNERFKAAQKPELRIGVGINTGKMNVGDMGSKFRRSYTVLGDAVNLASRLESLCKYYHVKILVGEETYHQTANQYAYRKLDKIRVKGRTHPVIIYEPLGLPATVSAERKQILSLHTEALEGYFQKQWDTAQQHFLALQEKDPTDRDLYQVFIERIEANRKSPLPSDWDGAYNFETK